MRQKERISITPIVVIVVLAVLLILLLPSSLSVFVDICLLFGIIGGIVFIKKGKEIFKYLLIFTSLIIGFVAALLADSRTNQVFNLFIRTGPLDRTMNQLLDRLASHIIATILSATIIAGISYEIKWNHERKGAKSVLDYYASVNKKPAEPDDKIEDASEETEKTDTREDN